MGKTEVLLLLTAFHMCENFVRVIEEQGKLCWIWRKGIFVFAAVSPVSPFISHPSHGFLWPNLDKHLLLPDLSAHASGLEFSSGIPWIIFSACIPPADVVKTSHGFKRKPVPSYDRAGTWWLPNWCLSLLVLVAFRQPSLSSRVGLLPEYGAFGGLCIFTCLGCFLFFWGPLF